jgi:hypothetical protein
MIGAHSRIEGAVFGRNSQVGRHVTFGTGALLGDRSVVTDFSQF